MTREKSHLFTMALIGAGVLGLGAAAHATPYAYSSNQITGLRVTYQDGSSIAPTTATTSISDTAQFDGYGVSGDQARGVVGGASTITQAYSGPGPAPAATYTPAGAGTFTGARSDAAIGSGTASGGGVTVSNVSEGYGNALGNSVGTNNAAIRFTVTGTGQALSVQFTDLIQLIVSTAALQGETASAAIQNSFSITADGASSPLFSFSPSELNLQISSAQGTPATNTVGPHSYFESFLTPVLLSGQTYNIALTSTASETIQPGTPVSTPEPASLAILGAGLFGAAIARRRRRG